MNKQSRGRKIEHWKKIAISLAIYDYIAIILAYLIALLMRFDCHIATIPQEFLTPYHMTIVVYTLICIVLFKVFGLYRQVWRHVGAALLRKGIVVTVITLIVNVVGVNLVLLAIEGIENYSRMPISYFFYGIILQFVATIGVRFSYRCYLSLCSSKDENKTRVMVVGERWITVHTMCNNRNFILNITT